MELLCGINKDTKKGKFHRNDIFLMPKKCN